MITEYIFVALTAVLAIGAPIYIFYAAPVEHSETKTRLMYLRERKDVIYENLRDLNFEYRAGKFSDADYESLKKNMEEEAANVLAEIAALENAPGSLKGARV